MSYLAEPSLVGDGLRPSRASIELNNAMFVAGHTDRGCAEDLGDLTIASARLTSLFALLLEHVRRRPVPSPEGAACGKVIRHAQGMRPQGTRYLKCSSKAFDRVIHRAAAASRRSVEVARLPVA